MSAIFVYGLLKPGFSLHHVVEPFVVKSADATARGRLYDAGVPAARFDEDGQIEGHVLWLDDSRAGEAFRLLDDIEDEGEVYRRRALSVSTGEGAVETQAYEYLLPLHGRAYVGTTWTAKIR